MRNNFYNLLKKNTQEFSKNPYFAPKLKGMKNAPYITDDTIVFGLLLFLLAFVFYTSSIKDGFWKKFYVIFPSLLMCYLLPSVFSSLNIISPEWTEMGENGEMVTKKSSIYFVASRYLLPAALVLMTLSIDLKAMFKLGPKALIMFFTGTIGVILGGPIAILIVSIFSPETVGGACFDAVWRGLSTIAGSWIGGGANQTALKEIFKPSDYLFSQTVAVDIVVAEIILAVLLYAVGHTKKIDAFLKADTSSLEDIQQRVSQLQTANKRIATFYDIVTMLGVAFVATGIAHFFAGYITPFVQKNYPELAAFSLTSSFFWVISIVTLLGILASFTSLRNLENAGASQYGSFFLYLLITTIGMQMDLTAIINNPVLFIIGILWMTFHVIVVVLASIWLKAPFFFGAVGSQANIGGAASAPVIAAAFHPSLVSVGVLLAVLGYAIGTYGGYICALLMQWVATG